MNRQLAGFAAACAATALLAPQAAAASTDGSTTALVTLTPNTRSITVSLTSIALNVCWGSSADWATGKPSTSTTLTLPNGFCLAGGAGVTVTNGAVAGHVAVAGTNATGTNGTGTWALTGNPAILPGGLAPASDQFNASTVTGTNAGWHNTDLATTATNDCAFYPGDSSGNSCGTANAGQSIGENLAITGPASSTGTATAYGFTVTWTATP